MVDKRNHTFSTFAIVNEIDLQLYALHNILQRWFSATSRLPFDFTQIKARWNLLKSEIFHYCIFIDKIMNNDFRSIPCNALVKDFSIINFRKYCKTFLISNQFENVWAFNTDLSNQFANGIAAKTIKSKTICLQQPVKWVIIHRNWYNLWDSTNCEHNALPRVNQMTRMCEIYWCRFHE